MTRLGADVAVTVLGIALAALAFALAPASATGGADIEGRRVAVEGQGTYTRVSADGLARMLERKDFALVNVHVPYAGEIPGTDLFVRFDRIAAETARLPRDRSARLVVYCRSGAMSAMAARTLVALGYTDVWDVDGGMRAWETAGHPLVRKDR